MNFLSTIPRSSEVINITAGFSVDEEKGLKDFDENNAVKDQNHMRDKSWTSNSRNNSQGSSLTSPHMNISANNININSSPSFNYIQPRLPTYLFADNGCTQALLQIAIDLDCTFMFHCRDGKPRFSFEPNSTASLNIRGPELAVVDSDNELHVIESNNGVELDSEIWKKTDLSQFAWAVRGKCQKIFSKM
ncbi:unnamed protein product [Dracunculus medinensis]|uniref:Uncharacterized protein n=1 Tax=Dracunculus medinensis TaxID=318479 RepID=A0A0N4U9Z4_DRAME|nr:unnamed protein product [Dracunculus medinensis]